MAGLVPAIPLRQAGSIAEYDVYFLASCPGGALYVGVTNDLIRRVHEHRIGVVKGHTKRFKIKTTRAFRDLRRYSRSPFNASTTSSIGRVSGRQG
jgi:hypothetical protein